MHKTYSALGRATVGATVEEREPFVHCRGDFPHAICNFALRLNLDLDSIRQLNEAATASDHFQIYHCPGDHPDHAIELLQRADYALGYELSIMACEGQDVRENQGLVQAGSIGERHEVATFMINQFFGRSERFIRNQIIASTVLADDLELWMLRDPQGINGACMLCEDEHSIGLYNLCVRLNARGKGLGQSIVETTLKRARRKSKILTLQCHPEIEGWYERFSFERLGFVSVFSKIS